MFARLWDIEEIYTGKRGSMNASMHGAGGMGSSVHGSIQGSVHGGVGASTHGISPTKGLGGGGCTFIQWIFRSVVIPA